ncbi:protein C1orf43-like [Polyodon spathula]|uniref:protein C1orf43-like n=1 Tax=Polyodon spathula TaxID=7913 RepID=UPI001B7E68C8|nr:protein C1orf43-like [Polyodon spathula]
MLLVKVLFCAVPPAGIPFHEVWKNPKSLTGRNFRIFLLDLRNASSPFRGVQKNLIDTLLDGYESARHGTGVFGETEYLKYQDALKELAAVVTARGTSSSGHKQTPPSPTLEHSTPPATPPPSTIQVTYLPSNQKSKRPKHFLELKSFKDKYNTLESTL